MKKNLLETAFVVAFTFMLIAIVAFFPFNLKFFNAFKNAFYDFKFTDIYYSELQTDSKLNNNIVLINIANGSREEIAKQIETISKYKPKSISIDANFTEKKDSISDTYLKEVITENSVITASMLEYSNEKLVNEKVSNKYFEAEHGYANLLVKEEKSVVRNFVPYMITPRGDSIFSFAAEITKKVAPSKYKILLARGKEKEIISYCGRQESFITLDKDAVIEKDTMTLKLVNGKHVIMGFLGEKLTSVPSLEDRHFTPMNSKLVGKSNPDTYGVVIHANILNMILKENYINRSSLFLNILLSILLIFFATYFFIKDYLIVPMWFHFKAKIIQLVIMIVLIYFEMLLYHYFHFKLDLSIGIAGVLLSVDVIYFYDGFAKYLHKKTGFNSIFLHSSH